MHSFLSLQSVRDGHLLFCTSLAIGVGCIVISLVANASSLMILTQRHGLKVSTLLNSGSIRSACTICPNYWNYSTVKSLSVHKCLFPPLCLSPFLPHSHPPSLHPFLPPSLPQFQVITRTLANYWMDWADLPPEALTTIAKGAYYSTKITDNLKLISFNSDYGWVSKSNKAVSSYTSVFVIIKW